MSARFGWSRSMLRYSAASDSVAKSVPSSSPSAVRRIHAGMACSDAGAMSRFITIAQVTTRVRSLSPAFCNASSNPMRFQYDRPHVHGACFAHRFHRDPLGVDADGGAG